MLDRPIERPMSAFGALTWTAALLMVEQVCVGVTDLARPGARTDIVNGSACTVLATSLVIFLIVRVHAPDRSLRDTLGFRSLSVIRGMLSVAAGAGLRPLLSTLEGVIERRWPQHDPEVAEGIQRIIANSSRAALLVGVFVVIPIAAELFFRGVLFGELRRTGSQGVALMLTTALYALTYALADPREVPTALLAGLAFAWLRARTGTVLAPVVGHLAFWAVEVVPLMRSGDLMADVVYPVRWIAGGAVIAALALAVVGWGVEET